MYEWVGGVCEWVGEGQERGRREGQERGVGECMGEWARLVKATVTICKVNCGTNYGYINKTKQFSANWRLMVNIAVDPDLASHVD